SRVHAVVGVLRAQLFGHASEAGVEQWLVLAQLHREAVAGPLARSAAKSVLQAVVLSDQPYGTCPGCDVVQALYQASPDKGTSAVAFAACPPKAVEIVRKCVNF